MIEMRLLFHGKVQRVGFRWTVVERAEVWNIRGTVRNLPNQTVEVIAQGSSEALENFLLALQTQPGGALIEKIEKHYQEAEKKFLNFTIV